MKIHANKQTHIRPERALLFTGLLLLFLELWKQVYLYFAVFQHTYHVWYLPFQLCSLPMYFCLLYAGLCKKAAPVKAVSPDALRSAKAERSVYAGFAGAFCSALCTFLSDFGLLGGVAALCYPYGFTFPEHPLLTLHGYVWHLLLIFLSLYISKSGLSDTKRAGFLKTLPLFFACAFLAFCLNVALHPYGDCDMFYISPYHLSSQPVFRRIDAAIGRPAGIAVYLSAVVCGAYLCHVFLAKLSRSLLRPHPERL